jgi:beta-galactosidase
MSDKQITLGVCYYPEHWPEELWDDDYRRMKELGFSIVRMGEFAWSIFEPEEGRFSFELFDRAIDAAHRHGLQVILGTPTATPPAWLTHRYPEVLNVSKHGVVYRHGLRRHNNYSSPVYRELCARITRRMAEHYHAHPAVVGWQIDNELNCESNVFYSDADHTAFREWAQRKYGTLERLNHAWGTVFWSQTYTDWEQVYLPRPNPADDTPNPHQALDEKRFISDITISFAKVQADILREAAPRQWITTNGLFGHIDNHRMTEELLDFISYDSYPTFGTIYPDGGTRPLLDRKWSLNLSNVRSISRNFCIMEQQSGAGGWVNRMELAMPRPGQMRLWTYQSIAHGADSVVYFRWRTATVGTEIYWHGLNDYSNRPNRRTREAARIGEELARIGSSLVGKKNRAEAAILQSYDNAWDGELDIWHGPLTGRSVIEWFKAFQYRHIPVDMLNLSSDTTLAELQRYKLLVYPHPAVLTDEHAELLKRYTHAGGTVVFGCRTGYKDSNGHCRLGQPLPGPVADLVGITVEDFTKISGIIPAPSLRWTEGGTDLGDIHAELFNDILTVQSSSVEVVAAYASDYYEGEPALTRNAYGEGAAWYFGAAFSEPVAAEIIRRSGLQSPLAPLCELPEQVELAIREDERQAAAFLLNYGSSAVMLRFKRPVKDWLSGAVLEGDYSLEPYGVIVLDLDSLDL